MSVNHHSRYPHCSIVKRDDIIWPNGRQLAFYTALIWMFSFKVLGNLALFSFN